MSIRTEKISILLVDDHKLIRDSWSFILNKDPRFQVVGTAGTADEAVAIAKGKDPRIVLMDLNMSPVSGFDITKLIRRHSPDSSIIGVVYAYHASICPENDAAGRNGLCNKNSSKEG